MKEQIAFMKKYREILQFGKFYRLLSPFEGNETAWMVVSPDKKTAIIGWYKTLNQVNAPFSRIRLQGLDPELCYHLEGCSQTFYGDELMNAGLITSDPSAGQAFWGEYCTDFWSKLYVLKAE